MSYATTEQAYRFFHEGALALADAHHVGMRINEDYYRRQNILLENKIVDLEDRIWGTAEGKIWKQINGDAAKLNSGTQLSYLLFDKLGYKRQFVDKDDSEAFEEDEDETMDKSVLAKIDLPMIPDLLMHRKLHKVWGTYIQDFLRQNAGGYIHANFLLHTTVSGRSSAKSPNLQNIPKRDKIQNKIIRSGIIPRPGHRLLELDFKGAEVRIAACYHHDPTMMDYLNDDTKDMHKDMALQIFRVDDMKRIDKDVKQIGKNGFVFPQFYGAQSDSCATRMWEMSRTAKLADGQPLEAWMRTVGLSDEMEFFDHVKAVADHFWNERFPVYTQWKKDFYSAYLRSGWFRMYTGFVCSGLMRRTQVCNYPIQGTSFHCLLWVFIQLNNWMHKHKMKSMLIGQIHDSVIVDAAADEFDDILYEAARLVRVGLPQHFNWICVPLDVEAEAGEVDQNWFYKNDVKLPTVGDCACLTN